MKMYKFLKPIIFSAMIVSFLTFFYSAFYKIDIDTQFLVLSLCALSYILNQKIDNYKDEE